MAVVAIPGHSGFWALDIAVERWEQAGSPRLTSAGRFYGEQKRLWDGWITHGRPRFQPAWNPDDPSKPLEHLRGIAFDLRYRADIDAMKRAGFVFTEPSEWWHCSLPNWRAYPKISSLAPASTTATPISSTPRNRTVATMRVIRAQRGAISLVGPNFRHDFDRVSAAVAAAKVWNEGPIIELSDAEYDEVIRAANTAEDRDTGS